MVFIKSFFKKLINFFTISQNPIGLKSMGIQTNYFNKIYKSKYSRNRFYIELASPVNYPFYFSN